MRAFQIASALAVLSAVGLPGPVQAQCVECAQQMFQATLSSNIWYNINQDQIDSTRSSDARNGTCYDANRDFEGCRGRARTAAATGIELALADQAEDAVLEVLKAEHRRRVQTFGVGNANQWLNRAAGDIGRQVATLNAEYRRRRTADGSTSAGRWYVDSAARLARRYVGGGGQSATGAGEEVAGQVPARTRQRAEDATFAVLDPEINRRSKRDGQTATVEWARSAGMAVGAGVRNLAPEYLQRAKADGQASAEAWYVEQARSLASRQVRSDN